MATFVAGLLSIKLTCFSSPCPEHKIINRLYSGILNSFLQSGNIDANGLNWPYDLHLPEHWYEWAISEWKKGLLLFVLIDDLVSLDGETHIRQHRLVNELSLPYATKLWDLKDERSWANEMQSLEQGPPKLCNTIYDLSNEGPPMLSIASPFSLWVLVHILLYDSFQALQMIRNLSSRHSEFSVIDEDLVGAAKSSAMDETDANVSIIGSIFNKNSRNDQNSYLYGQRSLAARIVRIADSMSRWKSHWQMGQKNGPDVSAFSISQMRFMLDTAPVTAITVTVLQQAILQIGLSNDVPRLSSTLEDLHKFTEHTCITTSPLCLRIEKENWFIESLQRKHELRHMRNGSVPISQRGHPMWLIQDYLAAQIPGSIDN